MYIQENREKAVQTIDLYVFIVQNFTSSFKTCRRIDSTEHEWARQKKNGKKGKKNFEKEKCTHSSSMNEKQT